MLRHPENVSVSGFVTLSNTTGYKSCTVNLIYITLFYNLLINNNLLYPILRYIVFILSVTYFTDTLH